MELDQLGSAGYTWEIQGLDDKHFEVVRSTKTPEPPQKTDLVGGPVKKVWLIRTREKGKRSWDLSISGHGRGKRKQRIRLCLRSESFNKESRKKLKSWRGQRDNAQFITHKQDL